MRKRKKTAAAERGKQAAVREIGITKRIAEAVHQRVDGLAGFAHRAVARFVALVVGEVIGVENGVDPHPHEFVGGGKMAARPATCPP